MTSGPDLSRSFDYVIVGGVLNQKVDGEALPVPVVDELRALGMRPAQALPALTRLLEAKD